MSTQNITLISDDSLIIISDDPDITITTSAEGLRGPAGSRVVEVGAFLGGDINPNEFVVVHDFLNPITILPNKCRAKAKTPVNAPTANVVFAVNMNGTQIGSITFLSTNPAKVANVNFTTANLYFETGALEIVAPSNLYGIGDVNITLSGER